MAKIDPLKNLINTILDDKEVVLFLGGGASMEGKQGEYSFPSSDELIDRVLEKFGVVPKNKKDRLNTFRKIIKRWEKENQLPLRLREFLDGEPGLAHYYLAALSIALFGESNALLYLTKNYDDLIQKAFMHLGMFDVIVEPLSPKMTGSEYKDFFNNIEGHLKEGRPVIIKLFGDIDSKNPIYKDDKIEFEPAVESKLVEWMKKPMIVIGYTFSDKTMGKFLLESRGVAPIFFINPSKKLPTSIKRMERVHHIELPFFNFIIELLEIIQEKKPFINKEIDKILKFLDPTVLYPDFKSIQSRVKKCSKISLLRAEEKIPKTEIGGKIKKIVPIPRDDTSPDFKRFIRGERPFMVVIGDSGSGKSTLLYRIANNEIYQEFITLFYDVHHIQSAGSLNERLCQDFRCDQKQLETIFEHLGQILSKENKKLLIIIDGLNEITKIEPLDLKNQIENLGTDLPQSIKIAYSCRTVYWNAYIKMNSPISSSLYHDSKEFILHFYSDSETMLAFDAYQDIYEFQGDFSSLKSEFQQKIHDPLMLRMLAEGYQKEKLPDFAPAVKIFKTYEEMLKRKFKSNTALMDFIYELISAKLNEIEGQNQVSDQFNARKIRTDIKFSNLLLLVKPKDPLVLLQDEGILSLLEEDEETYRFTYDRFFEYLLGKEIGRQLKIISIDDFTRKLGEKIITFQRIHFSFLQALKSEIVRQNIDAPKGIWSFYDPKPLKLLLYNEDVVIKNFAKEVLRELTFEAEENTIDALKGITDNELEWKLLALDIASDSPKIKPFLLEGIFSGEKHFIRRCIEILYKLNQDPNESKYFEQLLRFGLKNIEIISNEHAMGLIYYSSLIFCIEDHLGKDPFKKLKTFWLDIIRIFSKEKLNLKNALIIEFIKIFKDEGIHFFSEEARQEGMDSIWNGRSEEVVELARKMIPFIVDPNQSISDEILEIILFFGSELKNWDKRGDPENNPIYAYKLEYIIAQWILIKRSKKRFDEIIEILNRFVNSGFWLSIDFALCTMSRILPIIYNNNEDILLEGFSAMKKWTDFFEKTSKKFYISLESPDPFSVNSIPMAQASSIDAYFFCSKNGPIPYIENFLASSEKKKNLLALLCTRYFCKSMPQNVLNTIEVAINSKDETIKSWIERILKEIYMVYPRLVENFFKKHNFSPSRIFSIKYRNDILDSSGVEYNEDPLCKALFLFSRERSILVSEWYERLLKSQNLEGYINDLLNSIFDWLEKNLH